VCQNGNLNGIEETLDKKEAIEMIDREDIKCQGKGTRSNRLLEERKLKVQQCQIHLDNIQELSLKRG
jgi:hypothetical protein